MICGRGGIGRRATLRSLSGFPGGGSSPLDRTMFFVRFEIAVVAELVDALASGASSRKGVEVQVLSTAPFQLMLTGVDCFFPEMTELIFSHVEKI